MEIGIKLCTFSPNSVDAVEVELGAICEAAA
jgi:hypothetical protein